MSVTSEDVIRERLAALRDVEGGAESAQPPLPLEYVKRPGDLTNSYLATLRMDDGIKLGLTEIDLLTRGFREGDLVLIVGYVHSGKTQLLNTMILNNPDKRVLFFSLDDPAEMILAKQISMVTGIRASELERAVRDDDEGVIQLIRDTAAERLSNLIVVDDSVTVAAMKRAAAEAQEVWGANPEAVCVDYLGIVPGKAEEESRLVPENAKALKVWARTCEWPTLIVHQTTRSNGGPGVPITLKSAAYGGDAQATVMIGVRRKREWEELTDDERTLHEDTTTLHLVKNKRPGGRLTHHEGVDFYIDSGTGLIRPLEDGDLRHAKPAPTTAAGVRQQVMEGMS